MKNTRIMMTQPMGEWQGQGDTSRGTQAGRHIRGTHLHCFHSSEGVNGGTETQLGNTAGGVPPTQNLLP
jgi:hypothetical protein